MLFLSRTKVVVSIGSNDSRNKKVWAWRDREAIISPTPPLWSLRSPAFSSNILVTSFARIRKTELDAGYSCCTGREINEKILEKIIMGHTAIRQNNMEAGMENDSRLFGKGKNMSWITVYISGTGDFRDEVRKKLEHSDQRFLQGYIESPDENVTHDLFWLDDKTSLREFKEAISAKLIWKYRMRFYTSLEEFIKSQEVSSSDNFSANEQRLIQKMQLSASVPIL